MPTTTNFNWTTPADTDLVSQGAAAMRTLGDGIDASFVDLKGGTTGQVLSKATGTDLDFTWASNGWTLLGSSSLTTSTTTISGISGNYKDLRIVVTGYTQSTSPTTAYLRIGNGTVSSSGYYTTKNPFSGTWTGSTTATDVLGSGFTVTVGSNTDFICQLPQYAESNLIKTFQSQVQYSGSGLFCVGQLNLSTAVNIVSFVAGVTPTAGTISVYGRL